MKKIDFVVDMSIISNNFYVFSFIRYSCYKFYIVIKFHFCLYYSYKCYGNTANATGGRAGFASFARIIAPHRWILIILPHACLSVIKTYYLTRGNWISFPNLVVLIAHCRQGYSYTWWLFSLLSELLQIKFLGMSANFQRVCLKSIFM